MPIDEVIDEGLFVSSVSLTFSLHAHGQTLLIAAVLAAVPLALVYQTLLNFSTRVCEVFPDGSLEEALASFTAVNTIMFPYR